MTKLQKKILIFLIVLSVLSPTGILLPRYLGAGEAWGEWSSETINKKTGYTPEGMKNATEIKTPAKGYSFDEKNSSATTQSLYYALSGIIGLGLNLGITFLISKKIIRNDN